MTVARIDLATKYAHWFRTIRKPEAAKAEILDKFSQAPEPYE